MRLASSYKEVLSEINNSFDIRRSGGQFSQFATGDVAFEVVKIYTFELSLRDFIEKPWTI